MPLALEISGSSNKIMRSTAILAVGPAGTLAVVQNEQPRETPRCVTGRIPVYNRHFSTF